jgi:hypothetical protein
MFPPVQTRFERITEAFERASAAGGGGSG